MRNKKILKLYLAHNLDDRQKIRDIEKWLEANYNIKLFNPFYDSSRSDIQEIDAGISNRWELNNKKCKNIVKRDLTNLSNQDGIIAIIYKPSIGTTLEIGYAKSKNKKIFIVSEIYIDHPWLKVYANYLFRNLVEFKKWLDKNGYKKNINLK
jgi:nucleoside 2-deoxyribosyltransferase